jgi:phage FluMu protein Com
MKFRKIDVNYKICRGIQDSRGGMCLTDKLKKIKCEYCGRTLGELEGELKIQCRRCGRMNYIITRADQASQGKD